MSAKAQTLAAPARPIASYVVTIVLTLTIGAAANSLKSFSSTMWEVAVEALPSPSSSGWA